MGVLLDVFRVLSSCGSTCMILSVAPTMYQIQRTRMTGHMPITPLATMLINCHLWMMYGLLDGNYLPLFSTFLFGDLASLVYISIYYRHTTQKSFVNKILAACACVLAITTTYAVLGGLGYTGQSRDAVTKTMGYVGIVAAFLLYGSPFEKIALVFKFRCGVFIPIQMVVVGAVNSAVWVVYSLLLGDWFLFGPNLFTLTMGLVQIAVYVVFHPETHPLPADMELALVAKPQDAKNDMTSDVAGKAYRKLPSPDVSLAESKYCHA